MEIDTKTNVHNLGPATRIPIGEGRTFYAGGQEIAVFRDRKRRVYATQGWCPHRFGPLADGLVGNGEVVCPLHGYRFDLRSGVPKGHACETIRTFPVSLNETGEILLTLEER
ncbi:MAG: Rieske 2Fe-2S domain-containing protein [Luteitalea sp.]|nr:Rieske 2Fe-2S domain-containing protein [Luteitalea sp.]